MFLNDTGNNAVSQSNCQRKRKRVHIPHSRRSKEFVVKRNSKERQRVKAMTKAFEVLESVLPQSNEDQKISRSDILRRTIDHIRNLERKLIDDNSGVMLQRSYYNSGMVPDGMSPIVWAENKCENTPGFISNEVTDSRIICSRGLSVREIGQEAVPMKINNSFELKAGTLTNHVQRLDIFQSVTFGQPSVDTRTFDYPYQIYHDKSNDYPNPETVTHVKKDYMMQMQNLLNFRGANDDAYNSCMFGTITDAGCTSNTANNYGGHFAEYRGHAPSFRNTDGNTNCMFSQKSDVFGSNARTSNYTNQWPHLYCTEEISLDAAAAYDRAPKNKHKKKVFSHGSMLMDITNISAMDQYSSSPIGYRRHALHENRQTGDCRVYDESDLYKEELADDKAEHEAEDLFYRIL